MPLASRVDSSSRVTYSATPFAPFTVRYWYDDRSATDVGHFAGSSGISMQRSVTPCGRSQNRVLKYLRLRYLMVSLRSESPLSVWSRGERPNRTKVVPC